MQIRELREKLEQWEDDVEVFLWVAEQAEPEAAYELGEIFEDSSRPGEIGCFLQTGKALPPL